MYILILCGFITYLALSIVFSIRFLEILDEDCSFRPKHLFLMAVFLPVTATLAFYYFAVKFIMD